ncbi:galactonate dehydratase/D-galactarolactone cycloisomerase [Actinopolymorpha cephalotaxi]|uniref:Galactonate dehydratase/D-galactarolactone cycloisomerase n=1 Tax=Actinopolymorpha cephalotaxi TaxID=504797 RepID=A0A1I2M521_9ACTN|nr:enolase C-terminal domain-like protein [Actinopolymorpha cephalotaxi]NYH81506.1 L-alanine-DL-glutamate epimerase-like enolase superfamily enzyme [Actinopolymorpha cephalotaxi]SFF84351.1 galactonate dehydratase/D-galactarolactone cycloisomerase [Actinopolymorpha cephalotaxi]
MSAPLRITEVERIVVDVPFTPRCQEWNALLVWDWGVIEVVKVTTDAGLVGWGETLLHYGWGLVPEQAIAKVRGGNPADFLGDDSLGPGLQMAMYDLVGKALGVPVSALLGRQVRERVPIAWWNTKMSPEALAEEAKEAVAAGYVFHKFKARPWLDVYAQVDQVSAVTPPHYRLDIDWNAMLLSAGDAAPVLRELDRRERVAIYETPIPHADLEGYRHLRDRVGRPLAVHLAAQPFQAVVRQETCDGFVVEGGVATALHRGAICAEFGKAFWLQWVGAGLTTALVAHLGSVLTHARWPAVTALNNYADDLIVDPLRVEQGYLVVPGGPGLGVEVDEEALERHRMPAPHVLPERRHVLSVVWPSGRAVHYARMADMWMDFLAGNHPVQEPGVRMDVRLDDGSPEWRELFTRAQRGPVHASA